MTWLDVLIAAGAALLLIPSLIFFVECLLGVLPPRERPLPDGAPPKIAVLMPAHNEEAAITKTVRSLLPELPNNGSRLVVVADNCSDKTAELARAAGAEVIERSDPNNRGKGFALQFGSDHLAQNPPEILIIVDADCFASPGSLLRIAHEAKRLDRPAQADYLLQSPIDEPASRVSAFALLVRNRVRPGGMHRLGLPCHLLGSGMAFPWQVFRDAPPLGSHLVEDLMMGLDLAERGKAPVFSPQAKVVSELPEKEKAAMGQRRRWEHGTLSTMFRHAPRIILKGLTRGKIDLLALGLDLIVPPLALFVMMLFAAVAFTGLYAIFGSDVPLQLALASLGFVAVGTGVAWLAEGHTVLPFRQLLAIPLYVIWKIPLYLSFFKGRQQSWERTERTVRSDPSDPKQG